MAPVVAACGDVSGVEAGADVVIKLDAGADETRESYQYGGSFVAHIFLPADCNSRHWY